MAVSSNIVAKTKTTQPVNSTGSINWAVSIDIGHDSGSDTTDLVDCAIYVFVMSYWLPVTAGGITVDVNYEGNPYGTYSGTRGSATVEIISYANVFIPVIYPVGSNERINAIIKITYPSSTLQFTGTSSGLTDIQINVRDSGYKSTKYYGGSLGITDVEDSYSYRDNAGAAETVYASNSRVLVGDETVAPPSWSFPWGDVPQRMISLLASSDHAVISTDNFSTIVENTPDTSFESGATASIGVGTGYAKNGILTSVDPILTNVTSVERVEVWFNETGTSYISGTPQIDVMDLDTLPDSSPTWNEVRSTENSIVASQTIGSEWLNTTWAFTGSNLITLVESWLSDWATNHKGLALKFNDEASSNGEQTFATDNSTNSDMYPIIIIRYTSGGTPVTIRRRIMIV